MLKKASIEDQQRAERDFVGGLLDIQREQDRDKINRQRSNRSPQ
jgi:hypothetical protein